MNLGDLFKGKDGKWPQKSSANSPSTQKSSANSPSAMPAMQQVSNATKGATDAFSFVGSQLNRSLGKMGVKNINRGVGSYNGFFDFSRGFGTGPAAKPSLRDRIQSFYRQAKLKMMWKLVGVPNIPGPLQNGMSIIGGTPTGNVQSVVGNMMKLASETPKTTSLGPTGDGNLSSFASKMTQNISFGSNPEKVSSSFSQDPKLKEEEKAVAGLAGRLRLENNALQVLLKHQQAIEELKKENEMLLNILIQDLNVSPSKLQASSESRTKSTTPSSTTTPSSKK